MLNQQISDKVKTIDTKERMKALNTSEKEQKKEQRKCNKRICECDT